MLNTLRKKKNPKKKYPETTERKEQYLNLHGDTAISNETKETIKWILTRAIAISTYREIPRCECRYLIFLFLSFSISFYFQLSISQYGIVPWVMHHCVTCFSNYKKINSPISFV